MQEKTFVEKVDYYYDENGLMVLTKEFLLKRGKCCDNNCKHCPYKENLEKNKFTH
jgi:hypothetical protein